MSDEVSFKIMAETEEAVRLLGNVAQSLQLLETAMTKVAGAIGADGVNKATDAFERQSRVIRENTQAWERQARAASEAQASFEKQTGLRMKTGTPGFSWNENANRFVDTQSGKFASREDAQRAMVAEAAALKQVQDNYAKLDRAERQAAEQSARLAQAKTATREKIMALSGSLAVLQNALGDNLPPAAKKAFDGINTITSAAMIGASVGGPWGAAIGGVVGGIVALGSAALEASPEVKSLNQELEQLAQKNATVETLERLTNTTQMQAEQMLNLARSSPEAAKALRDLTQAQADNGPVSNTLRDAQIGLEEIWRRISESVPNASKAIKQFQGDLWNVVQVAMAVTPGLQSTLLLIKGIEALVSVGKPVREQRADDASARLRAEAEAQADKKIREENAQLAKDLIDLGQRRADNDERLSKDRADAERDYAQNAWRANRQLNDQLFDLSAQRQMDAAKSAYDRFKIDRTLAGALAQQDQQLADKRADIARSLTNKLDDLAWDQARAQREALADQARQRTDFADEVLRIERDLRNSISDLDWDVGNDLAKAQTERQATEVEYRAQHERSVLMRNSNDQIADGQLKLQRAQEESAARKQLADEEFAHRRQLAQRDAAEARADTARTYAEQTAQARQSHAEQTQDWQFNLTMQNTAFELQQQKILRGHAEQMQDLGIQLGNQKLAIQDRYNDEIRQIERAQRKFDEAYDERIRKILWEQALASGEKIAFAVPQGAGPNWSPFTGFASGGDFWVNRPTMFLAGEGGERERIVVIPESKGASRGGASVGNVTIYVNGAQSPRETARSIQRVLNDAVFQG